MANQHHVVRLDMKRRHLLPCEHVASNEAGQYVVATDHAHGTHDEELT